MLNDAPFTIYVKADAQLESDIWETGLLRS